MTTPDRTEDLLRLMLERRAGAPAPGWLLAGVAEAVRHTGQARGGHRWSSLVSTRRFGRLALVAAAALVLLALAAGVLVAARLILPLPQPTLPAIVALPSPSANPLPSTPEPTVAPTDQQQPPATAAPPAFASDTIAVVTSAGDDLRVRSKPGVGAGSEKFKPLLHMGSRMLVVDGPIQADGYDWYEVLAENDLFGWVAAGKEGENWIESAEPKCAEDLDDSALWTVDPIDFLVCYGDTPVKVRALHAELLGPDTGPEPPCRYADASVPCKALPKWLFEPLLITTAATDERVLDAFARTAVRAQLSEMPNVAFMTLTVAMDHTQAAACQIIDDRGRDLVPRDEAITRCRLRFSIDEVTWDSAMALPHPDDVAKVLVADLPVFRGPGGDQFERGLVAGDEVLIGDDPDTEGGVYWFTVVPRGGIGFPAGWVPFLLDGRPTLEAVNVTCPAPDDWRAIVDLDVAARVACFGSGEKLTFTVKVVAQPAEPSRGVCGVYYALTQTSVPCAAEPKWLTSATGLFVVGAEGDEGAEFWIDPRKVDRSAVPPTPTEMRLTGSFSHRDAWSCDVTNPESGTALVSDLAAEAFCRSHFVATKLSAVP